MEGGSLSMQYPRIFALVQKKEITVREVHVGSTWT